MYQVACVQFCPAWKDEQANLAYMEGRLNTLGKEMDLVIFPELSTCGYLFDSRSELERFARAADAPQWEPFREISRKKQCAIVLGTPMREGKKVFNAALTFLPDGNVTCYRKLHLFYKEKEIFDPGDRMPEIHTLFGLRLAVLICFDWAFPELWRILAVRGVDLVVLPSNLVLPGKGQMGIRGHAVCNRIFVSLCNRYGVEGHLHFTGNSQIVGPDGEIITEAPSVGERVIIGQVDTDLSRHKQLTETNHLFEDRRCDIY